jgi:GxxExxY protein
LLESVYQECLNFELINANLRIEREKPLPPTYQGIKLECGYRADFLVEEKIIAEIKSIEALADIHLAQTLTYLRLSKNRFGLLINFNVVALKDGIKEMSTGIGLLSFSVHSVCISSVSLC